MMDGGDIGKIYFITFKSTHILPGLWMVKGKLDRFLKQTQYTNLNAIVLITCENVTRYYIS